MRKIFFVCIIITYVLSGCTISNKDALAFDDMNHFQIEKDAKLTIQMEDASYANALVKLWNETYPKHKDILHIKNQNQMPISSMDIAWVSDEYVIDHDKQFYAIDEVQKNVELSLELHLQTKKKYFLPIEGKGLVFVYNEEELAKRKGTNENIQNFEDMKTLGDHVYYHNREERYVYPFLFTPHENKTSEWLESDTLYNNINSYRQLDDDLQLTDDQIEKETFYTNGSYVCGLIQNDGRYLDTSVYKKGKLHFMQMPTYKGVSYAPTVDTYGFVIFKKTKYPNAARAFLQLTRSRDGMNQLIETTKKTPLIASEDLEHYFIFDRSRKELVQALNGSQLRDTMLENTMKNSTFYADIQNSLYTKESNSSFRKRIKQEVDTWNKQNK